MDDEMKRKLKEKLDNGKITPDLYNEIVNRWTTTDDYRSEKSSEERKENQAKSERTSTVNVMGLGKFDDIFAKDLRVSGSVKVTGNVDVSEMEVSGTASIGGNVRVSGAVDISGSLEAGGGIISNSVELAGSLKADELESKKIDSSGWLTVKKVIKAESIDIDGIIDSEVVECSTIDINIGSNRGKIGILRCDKVNISRQWRRFRSSSIKIDEIMCKVADLEGVKAKRIVGEDVMLGGGCDVDYVESRTLKISEDAVVRKKNVRNEEA